MYWQGDFYFVCQKEEQSYSACRALFIGDIGLLLGALQDLIGSKIWLKMHRPFPFISQFFYESATLVMLEYDYSR